MSEVGRQRSDVRIPISDLRPQISDFEIVEQKIIIDAFQGIYHISPAWQAIGPGSSVGRADTVIPWTPGDFR